MTPALALLVIAVVIATVAVQWLTREARRHGEPDDTGTRGLWKA